MERRNFLVGLGLVSLAVGGGGYYYVWRGGQNESIKLTSDEAQLAVYLGLADILRKEGEDYFVDQKSTERFLALSMRSEYRTIDEVLIPV